jgi:hypothetical protein
MIPPSLLYLRIGSFGLWLPIFLFWPLGLLIAPFLLLAGLFSRKPIRFTVEAYRLCCAFRGTRIDIEQPDQRINIKLI